MTQASAEPYTNVLLYTDTNTPKMCTKVHTADNNAKPTQEVKKGLELTVHPAQWNPTHMYVYVHMHLCAHVHTHTKENHFLHNSFLDSGLQHAFKTWCWESKKFCLLGTGL